MSSIIIDRRVQQGKSAGNRQRVLRRLSHLLRDQVHGILSQRKLKDVGSPAEVELHSKDISEPTFVFQKNTGFTDLVLPANDRYRLVHQIPKSEDEGSAGGGQGENGEDSFQFMLSREEYLSLLFEGWRLPPLLRKSLLEIQENKFKRGGVVRQGNPGSLSVMRTFKASMGRRAAARGADEAEMDALQEELARAQDAKNDEAVQRVHAKMEELRSKPRRVPFIDPMDLRYRSLLEVPAPHTAAVMFCLMDVSASMEEHLKRLAKQFFTRLYLFLARKYEKV